MKGFIIISFPNIPTGFQVKLKRVNLAGKVCHDGTPYSRRSRSLLGADGDVTSREYAGLRGTHHPFVPAACTATSHRDLAGLPWPSSPYPCSIPFVSWAYWAVFIAAVLARYAPLPLSSHTSFNLHKSFLNVYNIFTLNKTCIQWLGEIRIAECPCF